MTDEFMQTCNMDERSNEEKLRDMCKEKDAEIDKLKAELSDKEVFLKEATEARNMYLERILEMERELQAKPSVKYKAGHRMIVENAYSDPKVTYEPMETKPVDSYLIDRLEKLETTHSIGGVFIDRGLLHEAITALQQSKPVVPDIEKALRDEAKKIASFEIEKSWASDVYDEAADDVRDLLANTPKLEAEQYNQWIAVEDRLPVYGQEALCWRTGDGIHYHAGVMRRSFSGLWSENYDVTHWMPLPAAPEVSNDSK